MIWASSAPSAMTPATGRQPARQPSSLCSAKYGPSAASSANRNGCTPGDYAMRAVTTALQSGNAPLHVQEVVLATQRIVVSARPDRDVAAHLPVRGELRLEHPLAAGKSGQVLPQFPDPASRNLAFDDAGGSLYAGRLPSRAQPGEHGQHHGKSVLRHFQPEAADRLAYQRSGPGQRGHEHERSKEAEV